MSFPLTSAMSCSISCFICYSSCAGASVYMLSILCGFPHPPEHHFFRVLWLRDFPNCILTPPSPPQPIQGPCLGVFCRFLVLISMRVPDAPAFFSCSRSAGRSLRLQGILPYRFATRFLSFEFLSTPAPCLNWKFVLPLTPSPSERLLPRFPTIFALPGGAPPFREVTPPGKNHRNPGSNTGQVRAACKQPPFISLEILYRLRGLSRLLIPPSSLTLRGQAVRLQPPTPFLFFARPPEDTISTWSPPPPPWTP